MTTIQIVRLIHIFGALGLFVVIGSEWVIHRMLAGAKTTGEIQRVMPSLILAKLTGPFSMVFIVLPGIYLTSQTQAWREPWIHLALTAVVVMAVLGGAVSGRRLGAIGKEAAGDDRAVPAELAQRIHDPVLWNSFAVRTIMVLGVVALMTRRPELPGAVGIMVVSVVVGLLFGRMLNGKATA